MAICWKCGQRGLFFKVNAEGLCSSCADHKRRIETLQEEERIRKANELSAFRNQRFPIEPVEDSIKTEWAVWERSMHDTHEQILRQKRALEQTIPISISTHDNIAYFVSSYWNSVYRTDLTSCTCKDFKDFNRPCKHIYRLFLELNSNHCSSNLKILDIPVAVLDGFLRLGEREQLDFLSHARFSISADRQSVQTPSIKAAIDVGLYVVTDNVSYSFVLEKMTKDEIILMLAKKSIQGYRPSWTKVKLIDWVCETQQAFLKKQYQDLITFTCSGDAMKWAEGIRESYRQYSSVLKSEFVKI